MLVFDSSIRYIGAFISSNSMTYAHLKCSGYKPDLGHFHGDTNPEIWVIQAEQYFNFYGFSKDSWLSMPYVYFKGEARAWFDWLYRNNQFYDWEHFKEKLAIHYQDRTFVNSVDHPESKLNIKEQGLEILRQLEDLRDAFSTCATKFAAHEFSTVESTLEDASDSALLAPLPQLDDEFSNVHLSVDVVLDDNSETQPTQVSEELNKVIPVANIIFSRVTQPRVSADKEDNCLDNIVDKVFDVCSEGQKLVVDVANTKQLSADFRELSRISDCHVNTFTTQCVLPNFPFDPGSNQLFDESPQQTNHKVHPDKQSNPIDLTSEMEFVLEDIKAKQESEMNSEVQVPDPVTSLINEAIYNKKEFVLRDFAPLLQTTQFNVSTFTNSGLSDFYVSIDGADQATLFEIPNDWFDTGQEFKVDSVYPSLLVTPLGIVSAAYYNLFERMIVSYSSWHGNTMQASWDLVSRFLKGKVRFKGYSLPYLDGIDMLSGPPQANYTFSAQVGVMADIPEEYMKFFVILITRVLYFRGTLITTLESWYFEGYIDMHPYSANLTISFMKNIGIAKAPGIGNVVCVLDSRQLNDFLNQLCIDTEAMRISDLMKIEGFVMQNVSRNVEQANIVAMEFYFPIKNFLQIVLVDSMTDIEKLEFPFGTTSGDQLFLTNFPFDPGDDLRLITCGLSLALGEWEPGLQFKTWPIKSHAEYKHTLLLLGLFGKFRLFWSPGSMTKVWDPGRQWYMHSCMMLCELSLVVSASSTFNYCYTRLELSSPITDRHKKNLRGLFVFPLWWMNLVQNFGWWHVLIDACALESNDIARLELSLLFHGYSFCSFYSFNKIFKVALGSDCEIIELLSGDICEDSDESQVEGSRHPHFWSHSRANDLALVQAIEHNIFDTLQLKLLGLLLLFQMSVAKILEMEFTKFWWSCWIKTVEFTKLAILEYKRKPSHVMDLASVARSLWLFLCLAENYLAVSARLFIELRIYQRHSVRLHLGHNIGRQYFGSYKVSKCDIVLANILALLKAVQHYHVFLIFMLKCCNDLSNHQIVPLQNQKTKVLQNLEDKVLNSGGGNVMNTDSTDIVYGPVIWAEDGQAIGPRTKSQIGQTIRQSNKIIIWDPG